MIDKPVEHNELGYSNPYEKILGAILLNSEASDAFNNKIEKISKSSGPSAIEFGDFVISQLDINIKIAETLSCLGNADKTEYFTSMSELLKQIKEQNNLLYRRLSEITSRLVDIAKQDGGGGN